MTNQNTTLRLGYKQREFMAAVEDGRVYTQHQGQGRMGCYVKGSVAASQMFRLEALLERKLVKLGEQLISGHKIELTELGKIALHGDVQ